MARDRIELRLLRLRSETGLPHPDFEGILNSPAIPSSVIARITTEPRLPPIYVPWYWDSNGLEFISATHTAWILYEDHGRSDRSQTLQFTNNSLPTTFDFGPLVQGGVFVVQCKVHYRNPDTGQFGDTPIGEQRHSIRGDNPTKAAVKSLLPEIPLQVIAYMESRFRQFDSMGLPLFGPPHGFGVMQLDNPAPSARQVWHWRDNVSGGTFLYRQKKSQVKQHFENIYKAHPDAPKLSEEQFNKALYQFYNGGFYWGWDAVAKIWKKVGPTSYGDEGVRIEGLVRAGNPPPGWSDMSLGATV